jgi:hypothetical protein
VVLSVAVGVPPQLAVTARVTARAPPRASDAKGINFEPCFIVNSCAVSYQK